MMHDVTGAGRGRICNEKCNGTRESEYSGHFPVISSGKKVAKEFERVRSLRCISPANLKRVKPARRNRFGRIRCGNIPARFDTPRIAISDTQVANIYNGKCDGSRASARPGTGRGA